MLLLLSIIAVSAVQVFAYYSFQGQFEKSTATTEATASCESLSNLSLPNAVITGAQTVRAGEFTVPAGGGGQAPNFKDLPAFCRVTMTAKPSSDSDIKIEVWLPTFGWNGKFQGTGNGGFAGTINPGALAAALRRGYAAGATDTGHSGDSRDATFALRPEKVIDFGHRAVHEMTVKAKAVVAAYYGTGAKLSYWIGCSTGGRQGLKAVQKYPDDYDAAIVGAPASYTTQLATQGIAVAQAVHKDESSYIPPSLYPVIHNAVLAACDAGDGVKDGVLENPRSCKVDPQVLQCKPGADPAMCLTAAQVEAARALYSPTTSLRTKQLIPSGLERGSELGWAGLAGPEPLFYSNGFFKYIVFKNANWDYKTLNLETAVALAEKADQGTIDATDPNLRPFFARGGKLLQYHGWGDQLIVPSFTLDYYEKVVKTLGGVNAVNDSYRLFMVPGMAHCGGGEGPNTFDMLPALEQWREQGRVPDQIIASRVNKGVVERTRPLCPYPQVAAYKGSGSTDDAASFVCKAP
jgi:Tannase and feruloyl esterase